LIRRTIFRKPKRKTADAVTKAAAKEPAVMNVVSWLNMLLEFEPWLIYREKTVVSELFIF
jgi:hypothetical protein